ncbi:MAG: CBS domain-containing protein [Gaiellaceae bacterium]
MKVEKLMTTDVAAVQPEASLKEVAEVLATKRISGVPVVDAEGVVLGVVSEGDIVGIEAGEAHEERGGLLGRLLWAAPPERLEARTAEEAMSAPALTVSPHTEVAEAARTMTEAGVNRLPVVDGEGKLLGIVTRADLVRAFVRSDEEIEHELREDVALNTLWIDASDLEIRVEGGEVTFGGRVESKTDAELLAHFATRVPGVVTVTSNLSWDVENPRLPRSDPRIPTAPRDA